MRLTVGPLPPAVYWRRRAIVLGALLFVIVLFAVRCSGASGADNTAGNDGGKNPAGGSSNPPASAPALAPSGQPNQNPSAVPGGTPTVGPSAAPPGQTGPCVDTELTVTVFADDNKVQYIAGAYVKFNLKIKNISSRSCARDIGSIQQEIKLVRGEQELWSSDDCIPPGVSKTDTLAPGQELSGFNVVWNGRSSNPCQTKPLATPGDYHLLGRVGTKWSDPVPVTVASGK